MLKLKSRELVASAYESVLLPKGSTQSERKGRAAKFCKKLGAAIMEGVESRKSRAEMPIDTSKVDWNFIARAGLGEAQYNRIVHQHAGLGPRVSMEATTFDEHWGPLAGQIVFAEIAQQMQEQASVAMDIVTSRFSPFRTEKIPGFGAIDSSQDLTRQKGEQFKEVGFTKEFIQTPETVEYGAIVRLHIRDMMFNRVGGENAIEQFINGAGKTVADTFTDQVYKGGPLGLTNYNYNNQVPGTGLAPYSVAAAGTGFQYWGPNQIVGNPLVDSPSIRNAQALLSQQVGNKNPRALNAMIDNILTSKTQGQIARTIIGQREERQLNGGNTRISTGNGLLNPAPGEYYDDQVGLLAFQNGVATTRQNGAEMWWGGEFKKAWKYLFNYDMQSVSLSGRDTQAYLDSGIVSQVRFSKMGTFSWDMHGVQRVVRCFNAV